tara:strand:- start:5844 stop:8993 length:3150 start_codon:yes stop_codon:yes gene_type:complete
MTQVNNNNNAAAEAARKAAEEAARKAAEEAAKKAQEAAAKKAQEEAAAAQREEASNRASEQQQTQQSQRATSFQNDGTRPQLATNRTTDDLRAQQLSQQLDNQQAQPASPQAPSSPAQTQTNQSLTQTQSPPSQTSSRRAEAAQARRAARAQLLRGTSDTTQTSTQNVETLQSPTQQEVAPTSQETPSTSLTGAPSTLRTEDREDANINCVDRAHEMIQDMSPEEHENTDVMFMRDPSNPDGNDAGHIMVRGDNGLLRDPNNPEAPGRTLEDIQADGRYEPVMQDGQPYTMPAEEFDQLMSTPPEQRDLSGIPQEVTEMRLADAPATTPNNTFTPMVEQLNQANREQLLAGLENPETREQANAAIQEHLTSEHAAQQHQLLGFLENAPSEHLSPGVFEGLQHVAEGPLYARATGILEQHAENAPGARDALVGLATNPNHAGSRDMAADWVADHAQSLDSDQLGQLSEGLLSLPRDQRPGPLRRALTDTFRTTQDPSVREATASAALENPTFLRDGEVQQALGIVEQQARAGDTTAIQALGERARLDAHPTQFGAQESSDILQDLTMNGTTPEIQAAAAHEVVANMGIRRGPTTEELQNNPALRDRLITEAASTGNFRARQTLMGTLDAAPITDDQIEGFSQAYNTRLSQAIQGAEEGTRMHEFGQLLAAAQLAGTDEFRDRIDQEQLNERLQTIMQDPAIATQLQTFREEALAEAIPELAGSDDITGELSQQMQDYLTSDDFRSRLSLMSPTQRSEALQSELGKLAGLDSDAAAEVSGTLLSQQLADNGLEMLASMPAEERSAALGAALHQLEQENPSFARELAGYTGSTEQLGSRLTTIIQNLENEHAPVTATNILRRLEQSDVPNGLIQALRSDAGQHTLRGLGTAAAVYNLANLTAPHSTAEALQIAGDVLKVAETGVDLAPHVGNLLTQRLGVGSELVERLAPLGSRLRFLGPAGNIVGSIGQSLQGIQELRDGDIVGGTAKLIGAGGGFASAAATIAVMSGASGPAAPAVAVIGTSVAVGAWIVDSAFGESDEETMLRQMGLLR